jgi:hypothetical protein
MERRMARPTCVRARMPHSTQIQFVLHASNWIQRREWHRSFHLYRSTVLLVKHRGRHHLANLRTYRLYSLLKTRYVSMWHGKTIRSFFQQKMTLTVVVSWYQPYKRTRTVVERTVLWVCPWSHSPKKGYGWMEHYSRRAPLMMWLSDIISRSWWWWFLFVTMPHS